MRTIATSRIPSTKASTVAMSAVPRTRREVGLFNIKSEDLASNPSSSKIPSRTDSLESTSSSDDDQQAKFRLIIKPIPSTKTTTTMSGCIRATHPDSEDNSLRSSLESQRQIIEEIAMMNFSGESLAMPETRPASPVGPVHTYSTMERVISKNPDSPPPSYDPRDGTEPLPTYTSTLEMSCVLDIKHEMDNPFDMSTDRWAPFLCILTGTKLDIFHTRSRTMSRFWNKKPKKGPLFSSWSLLHAQVGRADDYIKKANVVRLRIAAVQVLIACPSVEFMGDFIRLILASTGIALTIDMRADVETIRDPASLQHMPANRTLRKNLRAQRRLQDDIEAAIALEESMVQGASSSGPSQETSTSVTSSNRPFRNRTDQTSPATDEATSTPISPDALPGNASTIQDLFLGLDHTEQHSFYHRLTRHQRATVRRLRETSDLSVGQRNKLDWRPMWYSGTREADYIRVHLPTLKKSHALQNTELWMNFSGVGREGEMRRWRVDRERKVLIEVGGGRDGDGGGEVVRFEGKKGRRMERETWKAWVRAGTTGTGLGTVKDGERPPGYYEGFRGY